MQSRNFPAYPKLPMCILLKDLSHGFRVTNRKTIYNEITKDYVSIVHGEAVWTL